MKFKLESSLPFNDDEDPGTTDTDLWDADGSLDYVAADDQMKTALNNFNNEIETYWSILN